MKQLRLVTSRAICTRARLIKIITLDIFYFGQGTNCPAFVSLYMPGGMYVTFSAINEVFLFRCFFFVPNNSTRMLRRILIDTSRRVEGFGVLSEWMLQLLVSLGGKKLLPGFIIDLEHLV